MSGSAAPAAKIPLAGLPHNELAALLPELPPYRARQIFAALRAGAGSFAAMTNLPLNLRSALEQRFTARSTTVTRRLCEDGAVKLQIALEDGAAVEAVLLRDGAGRATACLSTQVGCPMGCVFCKTGGLGLIRNCNSAEIVEQFYHLGEGISNIVVMGMGEPLLNLEELRRALLVLESGFSMRRVTISTCGIAVGIRELARAGPAARLAVSVPSARQELRNRLMPACAAIPLSELKEALLFYQAARGQRITLETALFAGVNTGGGDARALIEFARGIDVMINLIPWNPSEGLLFEGAPLRRPPPEETRRFARLLEAGGLRVEERREKGGAVAGACGQLGSSAVAIYSDQPPGSPSL